MLFKEGFIVFLSLALFFVANLDSQVLGAAPSEDWRNQPKDEWPVPAEPPTPPSPYILYGPHGYNTYPHSRCQEVPTSNVTIEEIAGSWYLVEYITSMDGKPFPPHSPYLCPESKMIFTPGPSKMNITQVSFEWPVVFKDVVEWEQHSKKSGVFFHEENIFALWTMKVMEHVPDEHLLFFFCIDYTVWPGWNHRGVFILSRHTELRKKVKRKLSKEAHKRLRMDYHRDVNTTSCNPDEYLEKAKERWHPHRKINKNSYRAPIHPYISRKHRRNMAVLD